MRRKREQNNNTQPPTSTTTTFTATAPPSGGVLVPPLHHQQQTDQLCDQHNKKQKHNHIIPKYRDLSQLYVCKDTLDCACIHACIPCSYKIGAFDVALDAEFIRTVPNIRPEMCPRIEQNNTHKHHRHKGIMNSSGCSCYGYSQGMKILTVGDGDFSFSLALARIISRQQKTTWAATQSSITKHERTNEMKIPSVVATSYESLETLKRVYPLIEKTLDELEHLNVKVFFNVDATNLMGTLPPLIQNLVPFFHRIIWNFPCTAIADGQDGQNEQMKDNQMLVRKFVKQCAQFLHPTSGEIHFLHKTKPPYDQWKLEQIAVEVSHDDDHRHDDIWHVERDPCPFLYKGRVVFDRCLLLPYVPRKALDKKSFPCHDACLFVFGWSSDNNGSGHDSGTDRGSSNISDSGDGDGNNSGSVGNDESVNSICRVNHPSSCFPPTIPLDHPTGKDDTHLILPVTREMIDRIRHIQMVLGSFQDRKHRKK